MLDIPLTDPRHPFHLHHMEMALEEAGLAFGEDEVPVGAVVVHRELGVIARARNQRELLKDPTAHAEMIALTQAARALNSWRLDDAILYVTLEPCPMCAQAASFFRIARVVFGAYDPKGGGVDHGARVYAAASCHHVPEVVGGVREGECGALLRTFFAVLRQNGAGCGAGPA